MAHKIFFLASRPFFLELGVTNTFSSSSSVSFAGAALAVIIVSAAAAGEATRAAAGAEAAERPNSAAACALDFWVGRRSYAWISTDLPRKSCGPALILRLRAMPR